MPETESCKGHEDQRKSDRECLGVDGFLGGGATQYAPAADRPERAVHQWARFQVLLLFLAVPLPFTHPLAGWPVSLQILLLGSV